MTPKPVERLEKTLARVAREQGLDQERLRRWVSFLALCGVLEYAVEKGVIDIYYLKGGVAMELRFARVARTTKDFDLGLIGNRAERIRQLSEVLQLGFDEFTFRLKPEQHEMELADTVRVEVAVEYKTRAWQTIEVDLGPGEAREVDLVTPPLKVSPKWACPSPTKYVVLGSMSKWRRSFMRVPDLKGRIAPATYSISSLSVCSTNWIACAHARRRKEFSEREIPIRFHRRRSFLRSGV
jgi:Nucleotidyl transferase AbiEii toxin, Type IV TA system